LGKILLITSYTYSSAVGVVLLMGFWRGVGYFISVLIIIAGFLFFPIGLIGVVIGFIFIWMLKRSASQERMEKHLKEISDTNKERSLRQFADSDKVNMCSKCDSANGIDSVYCSKCGNKLQ